MILSLLAWLRLGRIVCLWDVVGGEVHRTISWRWGKHNSVYIYPFTRVGLVALLPDKTTGEGVGTSYITHWWFKGDQPPDGLWRYKRNGWGKVHCKVEE